MFVVYSTKAVEVHMKFTQKTKYFIFGAIATAVLVPLGTYAVKTIPVTFAEGDVVSASVMNSVLNRINDATALPNATNLVGTWNCTEMGGRGAVGDTPSGGFAWMDSDALVATRENVFTISAGTSSLNANISTTTGLPLNPNTTALNNARLSIAPNSRLMVIRQTGGGGIDYFITYLGNEKLQITQSTNWSASCIKQAIPPTPADALTAKVSETTTLANGTSVALTWKDQSTDETGFKVQYKTSAKGNWTTATTTAANATSYTLSGLTAGTYWIRVVAKNANGDSMSSSEVQAVIATCIANC